MITFHLPNFKFSPVHREVSSGKTPSYKNKNSILCLRQQREQSREKWGISRVEKMDNSQGCWDRRLLGS